ncbi:MAG: hypothetical protein AVDCRST_MAG93-3717, partial [uncultured Chloroflexia bacterium]
GRQSALPGDCGDAERCAREPRIGLPLRRPKAV